MILWEAVRKLGRVQQARERVEEECNYCCCCFSYLQSPCGSACKLFMNCVMHWRVLFNCLTTEHCPVASSASSFDGLDCIEYPSPWISSVRKIEDVIKEKEKKIQKSVSVGWSLALIFTLITYLCRPWEHYRKDCSCQMLIARFPLHQRQMCSARWPHLLNTS